MRSARVLSLALCAVGLLLSAALVVHVARAGMDNPIPPVAQVSTELTKGTGYCVSVAIGDELFGRVTVPFHKPDKAKLGELRVSIANAYRLIALQQTDPEKAAALREAAEHIRVPGDPAVESGRHRPRTISCTCAGTLSDGFVTHGVWCAGGCGNCYLCR